MDFNNRLGPFKSVKKSEEITKQKKYLGFQ